MGIAFAEQEKFEIITSDTVVITFDPPLKQFKSGTEMGSIMCNDGLVNVIHLENTRPACVTPQTAVLLLSRGWATEYYPLPSSIQCNEKCKDYLENYHRTCQLVHTRNIYGCYTPNSPLVTQIQISDGAGDPVSKKTYFPQDTRVLLYVNSTVQWTNMDSVPSSVRSDYDLFDSGPIKPNDSWTWSFDKVGVYEYHSEPHPWMRGTITVDYADEDYLEISKIFYMCPDHTLTTNSTGMYLACLHPKGTYQDVIYDLPSPTYKREPCNSTYGCSSKYSWIPQIPANLISNEQKQQVIDKLLSLSETQNWPSKPQIDSFSINYSADRIEANVQFFISGVKMPQHDRCEYYDSASVDLETLEILSGFRNFTNFEVCTP